MAAVGEGVVSEVSVLFALYGVNSLHEAVVGGVDAMVEIIEIVGELGW
jgi:hypothetical protein